MTTETTEDPQVELFRAFKIIGELLHQLGGNARIPKEVFEPGGARKVRCKFDHGALVVRIDP